jgi:cell division initiation protein
MLTPQEVSDKRFGKAFMGGYEMGAVDDFLETLTDDYTSLYKENALLKNKIRVLVDKLEEYRSVDESMRKTWREAQKNAEEMMVQAHANANAVLADAQAQADAKKAETVRLFELEEHRLNTARQQTITFVNSLREIYQRQIEQLAVIPTIDLPPQTAKQVIEDAANQAAFEISQSVMAQIQDDYKDSGDAANAPEPPAEPDAAPDDAPEDAAVAETAEPSDEPALDTLLHIPPETQSETLPKPPLPEVSVIHTREGGFYGPDGNELDEDAVKLFWEPEKDTVVPRPRQDGFPDLEEQFGAGVKILKKK